MTQANLSVLLGVPQSWISNVEAGVRRVDIAELMTLAPILGVSTLDLIAAMEAEVNQ
ncbi:helix-turn-helix domain-containing protein [Corynebacterium kroppenstedtii]|uniref:helix-turn-helix domain-containing protein n=1 Tax=Corynebacterium kroppenstedtii TaxID=161879 RepID=UPI003873AB41